MVKIVNFIDIETECCGCSSCSNSCVVGAIGMIQDDRGFTVPVIDDEKCIDCSLCILACPVFYCKNREDKKLVNRKSFLDSVNKSIVNFLDIDKKCSGCSACFNSCNVKAINMVPNEKGFLVPAVDKERCVGCGKCVQVCPVYNFKDIRNPNFKNPGRYAYTATKDVLLKSSSGGAFTAIAEKILDLNGVVFGVAYNRNFEVEHIAVENIDDLDKIRGSKYVQSNQKDCYLKVRELLEKKRIVLYSGTPCQIAGLKSFLGKDYQTLFTVDLICHGVPSPKVFKDYLYEAFNVNKIDKIIMRDGENWATKFDILFKDGEKISRIGRKSVYINGFLSDICLRDSCYKCCFASLPRQADITIGDFWGVKKFKIGKPFESRSSVVLMNNDKGGILWREILNNNQDSFKDINNIEIKKLNKNIYAPNSKFTKKTDLFWGNYKKMGVEKAVLKTLYGEDNVGLVLYASNNYGSCATNFCLYKAIKDLGYKPIILDSLTKLDGVSKDYLSENCNLSSRFMPDGDMNLPNMICDSYVLGSDYSLNVVSAKTRNNIEYFLMAFAGTDKRKIAYAPSLGSPNVKDPNTKFLFKRLLEKFTFLSFREDSAVEFCKENFQLDSHCVLDPVFLVEVDVFKEISSMSTLSLKKPYICSYILNPNPDKIKFIEEKAKELNIDYYVVIERTKRHSDYDFINNNNLLGHLSFKDFIYLFFNSEFIITDSFHGTCFALLFNKQFVSFKNRNRRRFDALQTLLNKDSQLCRSIFDSVDDAVLNNDFKSGCNFEEINKIITYNRIKCINLLKNALSSKILIKDNDKVADIYVQYARLWNKTYSLERAKLKAHEIDSLKKKVSSLQKEILDLKKYDLFKYFKYKVLSKITFGKVRSRYKDKYKHQKSLRRLMKRK